MKLFSGILEKWLAGSRAYILVLVGVILLLPSVFTGLSADDYFLSSIMLQRHSIPNLPNSPLDAFAFLQINNHGMQQWIERGMLPWWTNPHIKIAFWRPLSALTHWLDFTIYPDAPWLMHVHNLIWYGSLCMLVLVFYRRFFIAYWRRVISRQSGFSMWLVLRPCCMQLMTHAAWPLDGFQTAMAASPRFLQLPPYCCMTAGVSRAGFRELSWRHVCLGMGLLSGESALAIFGYLVAYELFISRGSLLSGFLCLVPAAAVVVIWRFVYSWLGYGTSGTGLYLDPAQSPMLFFGSLCSACQYFCWASSACRIPRSGQWFRVFGR